jgi:Tat protein secretion system quality control protein TatD with DNase activity
MTAHTPTPWGIPVADHTNSQYDIFGDHWELAAKCSDRDNALHIVRCVNAHDELVAALRKIENLHASGDVNVWADRLCCAINTARAALAKVQS